MNEKKLDKESLDWAGTIHKDFWDNGWVGSVTTNFAPGGGITNVNVTVSLRPGQRVEIKEG